MNTQLNIWKPILFGFVLLLAIFLIEYFTEFILGSVIYLLVVIYILWLSRKTTVLPAIGIILTIVLIVSVVVLFPILREDTDSIISRSLSLVLLWVIIYIIFKYQHANQVTQTKINQANAIIENANEGILFCDADGKIILTNRFLDRQFGYSSGELLNKNIAVLISPDKHDKHSQHLTEYCKHPHNLNLGRELKGFKKDKTEFSAEINLSYFYDEKKLIIIAFISDVTEKVKKRERQIEDLRRVEHSNLLLQARVKQRNYELEQTSILLKKSDDLYKAISHNFPDGIIGVLDKNMRYILVDGKELKVLNLDKEALLGDHIFDGLSLSLTKDVEEELKKVYQGQSVSFDINLKGRDYNISAVPLQEDKPIEEIVIVIKNISDRKKLVRSLMKTIEKEKELNSLKSRFVSTASHEFRTPLSTILSSVFLLENYHGEQFKANAERLFDRIKRSSYQMMELLDEFLSTGRIEDGNVEVSIEVFDLREFIGELINEFQLIKKESQQINLNYEADLKFLESDKRILKRILVNVISNALKYSPPVSEVLIKVYRDENNTCIDVTDQGIGIPEEERKYIFKKFFRAHNTVGIQGTGLGLNIASNYCKLLNGRINFISNVNSGTTFKIKLPLKNQNTEHKPLRYEKQNIID